VLVPINALLYEAEKVRVFTIEDETAREKRITIGNKYGEWVEVLSGVKEGEQVVVAGHQNLSESAKVRIAQPAKSGQVPAEAPAKSREQK
jgi:multidrug efflux pump subunit AcrA (membrane-fusion protein)